MRSLCIALLLVAAAAMSAQASRYSHNKQHVTYDDPLGVGAVTTALKPVVGAATNLVDSSLETANGFLDGPLGFILEYVPEAVSGILNVVINLLNEAVYTVLGKLSKLVFGLVFKCINAEKDNSLDTLRNLMNCTLKFLTKTGYGILFAVFKYAGCDLRALDLLKSDTHGGALYCLVEHGFLNYFAGFLGVLDGVLPGDCGCGDQSEGGY